MRRQGGTVWGVAGVAGLLLAAGGAAGGAMAHHGWGSYEPARVFTITQPVAELEWANPHVHLRVQHEGAMWEAVLAPPFRMQARGLNPDMIKTGTPVTIEGYPHRTVKTELRAERITVGGKTFELR